jgi:hypothetical protein
MSRERFAVIVILAHLACATLHGFAHVVLAVPVAGPADLLLIAAAVYVGPLVALAALLSDRRVAGAVLLSASMAAALIYGLAFHYFLRTPDHAAYAPPGPWGTVFRFSAAMIALFESCGIAAGALLSRSVTAARSKHAYPPEPPRGGVHHAGCIPARRSPSAS